MKSNTGRNYPIVIAFCVTIILTLGLLYAYLGCTTKALKESQDKIINAHTNHIAKVDSIFSDMKKVILSSDSGMIANAPALLSQLQRDSSLFRREILLSQEEMNNLTELHLNKIDSNYDQMGVWFGVAGVIFLVIGFFSMFKIEESKNEAKNVLEDVKQKGEEASKVVDRVEDSAAKFGQLLDGMKQDFSSFVEQRSSQLEKLERNLSAVLSESTEKLNVINQLLEEVETKNTQYEWSIQTMQEQMQQMNELTSVLREVLKDNGKEATDEQ